jgi:16S rRNA (guanine966-N2)-methyltransferase
MATRGLRIIAGTHRGRTFAAPTWEGLRPTSDRLRETLFNILGPSVTGTRVLDVCAGTGALAFEALSRGALSATLVDDDPRAVALMAKNAATLGLSDRCIIVEGRVPSALTGVRVCGPYDLVLMDPPYDAPWIADALGTVTPLVAPGGLVVLEHAGRNAAPQVEGLGLGRTRRAGDSALSMYRPGPAGEGGAGER